MKLLYIFPHPDDESFGPALAMSHQRRHGDAVYLLTLTKGEATKQRHRLGLSKDEMGEVRYREMLAVEKVLDLSGMTVLDLPDSGLKEMDPREIERVVSDHIARIRPDVVITYPVHGISGFQDHLVTHAVVKRVFLEMRDNGADYLRRLAFFTLREREDYQHEGLHRLNVSTMAEVDCLVPVEDADVAAFNRALDCYETYLEVIEQSKVREAFDRFSAFEIYREHFEPPLSSLTDRLPSPTAR